MENENKISENRYNVYHLYNASTARIRLFEKISGNGPESCNPAMSGKAKCQPERIDTEGDWQQLYGLYEKPSPEDDLPGDGLF